MCKWIAADSELEISSTTIHFSWVNSIAAINSHLYVYHVLVSYNPFIFELQLTFNGFYLIEFTEITWFNAHDSALL